MNKIKSAEEYFDTYHERQSHTIGDIMRDYADYVLKAKLESITDEVIQNKAYDYSVIGMEISSFMDGSEWLKQKLLKDE